jgi:hypothetical protein
MSTDPMPWIKATASGANGNCVEMRSHDGLIQVRDSKHGDASPVLSFTRAEWAAWLDGTKKGEFDSLV